MPPPEAVALVAAKLQPCACLQHADLTLVAEHGRIQVIFGFHFDLRTGKTKFYPPIWHRKAIEL